MINKKTLTIAAVLVLIPLIAAYFFLRQEPGTNQLYKEHFEPYPNIISSAERSEGEASSEVDEIMNEYEAENYKKALRRFNKYLKKNPDKNEVKLYRGITHLKLGNKNKAIDDFEEVAVADNKLGAQATWYLGLAYLKKGDQDQASVYFQSLMKKNTQYAMDAEEILDKLGNAMAVGNNRLYEITDEGKYKFSYWQENEPDPHPITERTFYLEAKELDILPEGISYRKFNRLSINEQQTLITHGQQDIIAQMKDNIDQEKLQKAEDEAQNIIAEMRDKEQTDALAKSESPTLDKKQPEASTEKVEKAKAESTSKADKQTRRNKATKRKTSDMHWMVKTLTDAGHGTAIPEKTGSGTNTAINKNTETSKETSTSKNDAKEVEKSNQQKEKKSPLPSKDDLPWVIDAMTNTDDVSQEPSFNTEKDQENDIEKEMTELVQLMTEPASFKSK